jgi:hypothetical protein
MEWGWDGDVPLVPAMRLCCVARKDAAEEEAMASAAAFS